MTRVSAPDKELLDQCAPVLAQAEAARGYRPNDVLSLCHWPELLNSLGGLVQWLFAGTSAAETQFRKRCMLLFYTMLFSMG